MVFGGMVACGREGFSQVLFGFSQSVRETCQVEVQFSHTHVEFSQV